MKKNSVVSIVIQIIVWVVVLALVVGGVCFVLNAYADNIKDIFAPEFRVECNGKVFRTSTKNYISFTADSEVSFVVYNGGNFHYAILPNVEDEDFVFTVDGVSHLFSDEQDLTPAFSITEYDGAIVLDCSVDYSVKNVLSTLWGGKVTTDYAGREFPYKLVFQSERAETITIYFGKGITLDASHVLF